MCWCCSRTNCINTSLQPTEMPKNNSTQDILAVPYKLLHLQLISYQHTLVSRQRAYVPNFCILKPALAAYFSPVEWDIHRHFLRTMKTTANRHQAIISAVPFPALFILLVHFWSFWCKDLSGELHSMQIVLVINEIQFAIFVIIKSRKLKKCSLGAAKINYVMNCYF